jgi:molybdopterin/thiamine biosynthesis adenylyltransferase
MTNFSDQINIFDPSRFSWPVHLIGLGGIGSAVLIALVKMGVDAIHVWDDDILEDRNLMAEVGYSPQHVGLHKVEAAAESVEYLVGDRCKVIQHKERVTADTTLEGVVISGVDSMKSRQEIWKAVQNCIIDVPFYIDGRIGGEYYQVLSIYPSDSRDVEIYESWLFDDEEASKLECGARATAYVAMFVAAEIAHNITLYYRDLPININIARSPSPEARKGGV